MAGPILPSESNAFSVGSSNNRFLDAYFSRAVDISGVAISPDAAGGGIKVTSAATGSLVDVEANYILGSNIRSIGDVQADYVIGSNIRSVGDVQAENLIADYVLGSNIRSVGDVQANYILGSNIRSVGDVQATFVLGSNIRSVGDVQANFILGSNIRSVGDVQAQNITASGLLTASNIRVLGDYVILDTITSNTEQMVITNDGTGPALKVTQTGANSIAEFYDDGNSLAFKVANDGLIGIGTANPQAKMHVQGNILASGTVTGSSFVGIGSSLTTLNADNVSSGTLAVARGGTGNASYTVGDLIYASGTTALSKLADVATGNSLISGGVGVAPSWGKIGLTTHVTGTLGVANGGTGTTTSTGTGSLVLSASPTLTGTVTGGTFSGNGSSLTTLNADNVSSGTLAVARGGTGNASYTVGDLIYASGTTALSKLADVATGNSLISGGVGVAPSWGKIGLTTHVSGTLGVANGGTGLATLTANKVLVGNGTTTVLQPTNLHWDNTNSRLGVGIASPSERLTVAGNLFLDSAAAALYVGNNANSTIGGTIYFGGTYGDNWYDHAVIESRVYETSTEKSELLLFKGNDVEGSGPDRIRLRASDIVFDTYDGATQDRAAESIRMVVKQSGNVGIGTTNPQATLHVNGTIYCANTIAQIRTSTSTSTFSTTQTTFQTTDFTVTNFACKFSNSTILITANVGQVTIQPINGVGANGEIAIFRQDTGVQVGIQGTFALREDAAGPFPQSSTVPGYVSGAFTPGTTSPITYMLRFRHVSAAGISVSRCVMVVTEIAT